MSEEKIYDVSVIGGGLAGLSLSVLMAKKGHSVILFEKEHYPFTKVCGEYISMESWDFLAEEIGVPLAALNVSMIRKLQVSSPNGNTLNTPLDTGGFGISRYRLDHTIKEIAEQNGVTVKENCKAEDIVFANDQFTIKTAEGNFTAICCCGAWGKRSNIDIKRKRDFIHKRSGLLNNYVGIKYHVKGPFPPDTIFLHNFKDGYCGLSKIEDDLFCLCYFMKASNLKKSGHAIEQAEEKILSENPHLQRILATADKAGEKPVTISQVSLSKKAAVEDHIFMLGDAAGMISPLCGNGMSIAMHSAKIAAAELHDFLENRLSRKESEKNYAAGRKKAFGARVAAGRFIQSLFGKKMLTNIFLGLMKKSKFLTKKIIGLTHGKRF